MKIENIPQDLITITAASGGSVIPRGNTIVYGEDRTADYILLETYLSLQIPN